MPDSVDELVAKALEYNVEISKLCNEFRRKNLDKLKDTEAFYKLTEALYYNTMMKCSLCETIKELEHLNRG